MKFLAQLLRLASMLVGLVHPEMTPRSLKVETTISPGPYFVGQAIEVRVEVEGGTDRAAIDTPRLVGATFRPLPPDSTRPTTARYMVVPERPGLLLVQSFRCRSGGKAGSSRPTKLEIANVPSDGRTPAFLGGIGSFQVRAEAGPSNLRTGQAFDYRVQIIGPAAWGSVRSPILSGWNTLKSQFRVEALPDVLGDAEPATRTFHYRLRPLKSGKFVLPPVSVAAFDPITGHYSTRATSSLPILVEGPPRFDPARLDYGPIGGDAAASWPGSIAVGVGLGVAVLAGLGYRAYKRRNRRASRVDPMMLALELIRGFEASDDEVAAARSVAEALTVFLERVDGRSPGVLTPPEARQGFERVTGDRDLGQLAQEVVRRCDRARFGKRREAAQGLIDEGRRLFGSIAEILGRKESGGPREAVETARN